MVVRNIAKNVDEFYCYERSAKKKIYATALLLSKRWGQSLRLSYMIFYGDFERPLRRRFREVFEQFFRENCPPKKLGNDSFHRRDRFRQIFVQIGAILAIFRPFELFGR